MTGVQTCALPISGSLTGIVGSVVGGSMISGGLPGPGMGGITGGGISVGIGVPGSGVAAWVMGFMVFPKKTGNRASTAAA